MLRTTVGAAPAPWPGLSFVALDHWSYQAFDRLSTLGLIPLHAIAARPITRIEAKRLVEEATSRLSMVTPRVAELVREDLDRLREAFDVEPVVEIALPPRLTLRHAFSTRGLFQLSFGSDAESYVSFQLGTVFTQIGITSSWWGPGSRSALLLSNNAGALPMMRVTAEVPRARLTKVMASLERSTAAQASVVVIATRLDWMASQSFRLGLSEAVITPWGAPLTFYHLLQPLPVLWGTIASHDLHDALGHPRNTLASVDFDWLPRPGIRLYGVGFIDDALDRIAERKSRIGLLGGVFIVDPFKTGTMSLRIEYSAVTNGTYSPNFPNLEHAYRGRILGHWLGPDGDDLYVELTRHLDPLSSLQLSFAYTRHGEGRIGQPSPEPENWFLSGVVEHRQTLGFQLRRMYSASLEVRYLGEIAHVANWRNQAGIEAWEGSLGLGFTYRWPATPSVGLPSDKSGTKEPLPGAVGPPSQFSFGRVGFQNWAPAITSAGPLAGAPSGATYQGIHVRSSVGSLPLSLNYDGGGGRAFWSGDLLYPVARFVHGGVWIAGGWGGLAYEWELGGANRQLSLSGPRLGMALMYEVAPGGRATPLRLRGEISTSPVFRWVVAPQEGGAPFRVYTYSLGAEWVFQRGWSLEVGYRGAAAIWRIETPDQTTIRWDGLHFGVSFQ